MKTQVVDRGDNYYVFFGFIIALFIFVGCTTTRDFRFIYKDCVEATVEILVDGRLEGSGFFVGPDGSIVTAAHVIKSGKRLEARTMLGKQIGVRVTGLDLGSDLALLSPVQPLQVTKFLHIADRQPGVGERVVIIGTALFRHNLILPGWVARDGLTFEFSPPFEEYIRVYHVAANTPPGTSGACWLDSHGRVVGVQSGMMTLGTSAQGLAFVAPLDSLKQLVQNKKNRSTSTIRCVVEELWEQQPDTIKKFPESARGVIVAKLANGGPAEKAGLKKGDLIISVNGISVQRRDDFNELIRRQAVGTYVNLEVSSPGFAEKKILNVQVQSLEEILKSEFSWSS